MEQNGFNKNAFELKKTIASMLIRLGDLQVEFEKAEKKLADMRAQHVAMNQVLENNENAHWDDAVCESNIATSNAAIQKADIEAKKPEMVKVQQTSSKVNAQQFICKQIQHELIQNQELQSARKSLQNKEEFAATYLEEQRDRVATLQIKISDAVDSIRSLKEAGKEPREKLATRKLGNDPSKSEIETLRKGADERKMYAERIRNEIRKARGKKQM